MEHPDKAIVCGTCDIPVTAPFDPKPDDQVVCIRCGARDAYKDVWEACKEHIKYRLERAAKGYSGSTRPMQSAPGDDSQKPLFKWRIKD